MDNQNNNQKPVDEMIRDLLSNSKFENFLREKNIADVDQILKLSHYQIGNDRAGFIANLKEKNNDDVEKIMWVADILKWPPSVVVSMHTRI
jgi:hypothetical protein